MMSGNDRKLQSLLVDILLIDASEYRDHAGPDEIETWDSLAVVDIAAGVHREFGYRMTPAEMVSLQCIGDIKAVLARNGAPFE